MLRAAADLCPECTAQLQPRSHISWNYTLSFLFLNCYKSAACCHLLDMADRLSDWPIYSLDVHRLRPDTNATPRLGAQPRTYSSNSAFSCHTSEWMASIIETFLCYWLYEMSLSHMNPPNSTFSFCCNAMKMHVDTVYQWISDPLWPRLWDLCTLSHSPPVHHHDLCQAAPTSLQPAQLGEFHFYFYLSHLYSLQCCNIQSVATLQGQHSAACQGRAHQPFMW